MSKTLIFESTSDFMHALPPGATMKMIVENQAICLINYRNQLRAVANSCPHLGESLAKGTLNPFDEIVCPWHSYRFNISTGEEALRRCGDLRTYRVLLEDDRYFLML